MMVSVQQTGCLGASAPALADAGGRNFSKLQRQLAVKRAGALFDSRAVLFSDKPLALCLWQASSLKLLEGTHVRRALRRAWPKEAVGDLSRTYNVHKKALQAPNRAVRSQGIAEAEQGRDENGAVGAQSGSRRILDFKPVQPAEQKSVGQHKQVKKGRGRPSLSHVHPQVLDSLISSKTCETCQLEKPIGDFRMLLGQPDLHSKDCLACTAEKKAQEKQQPFPQKHMEGRTCSCCKRFKLAVDYSMRTGDTKLLNRCRACNAAVGRSYMPQWSPVISKECTMCNEIKPAAAFPRKTRNVEGIQPFCRRCIAEVQRKEYLDRPVITEPLVAVKRCPDCQVVKPAAGFHRSRKSRDGLQFFCKVCQIAKIYARRKGAPNEDT